MKQKIYEQSITFQYEMIVNRQYDVAHKRDLNARMELEYVAEGTTDKHQVMPEIRKNRYRNVSNDAASLR